MVSTSKPAWPQIMGGHAELERENDALKALIATYDHLTGLALQNADLGSISQVLSRRSGRSVAVLDPTLQPLTIVAPSDDEVLDLSWIEGDPRVGQAALATAETRRALRVPGAGSARPAFVVAPISTGDEVLAYLMTVLHDEDVSAEDLDLLLTQHAATVYAVVMTRERAAVVMSDRVRDELIEGLLLGAISTPDEVRRWARYLGYDTSRSYRVLSLMPFHGDDRLTAAAGDDAAGVAARQHLLRGLRDIVARQAPEAIVTARRDEVVVLVPERRGPKTQGVPTARQLAEALVDHFTSMSPRYHLVAGVGGLCADPGALPQSYSNARRAAHMSQRLGRRRGVAAFEDLGIYRLLLQVPDPEELRRFADHVLGPVAEYDAKHDGGLLRTLGAYLRHNGSHQSVARELHVHANTVGYRLHRIQTITGLHLESYEDRLIAQVAMKILEAIEATS